MSHELIVNALPIAEGASESAQRHVRRRDPFRVFKEGQEERRIGRHLVPYVEGPYDTNTGSDHVWRQHVAEPPRRSYAAMQFRRCRKAIVPIVCENGEQLTVELSHRL